MPFKIIETLEKGQKKLCIIPSAWESKGILRWPRKRLDVNKLLRNEKSIPLHNWSASKCNVKRILSSYEEAARELDIMVQNSDTEIDNVTESTITTMKNTNFNALADQLALSQSETPSTSAVATMSSPLPATDVAAATGNIVYYVDDLNLAPISVDSQTQKTTELSQIENSLQLILNNQNTMSETIKALIDNQKKLFHKLATMSIQMEDGFSKIQNEMSTNVVPLAKADSIERESFEIKPVDSIQDIKQMELLLSNKSHKNKLLKQLSFVCSSLAGNGFTCGYKVLDMFLSRDFVCKCSWTGGSRNSSDVKIGLKKYKNFLNFFCELIRMWDKTYTEENNEAFFKTVLKNALKRKLSKNERASTKRQRTKKVALENKVTDKRDQGKEDIDQNKIEETEKVVIDKSGTNKDHDSQVKNHNKAERKEIHVKNKDKSKKNMLKKKRNPNIKSKQDVNQIETEKEKTALENINKQGNQITDQTKDENEQKINDKEETGASDADDEEEINEDVDDETENGDIEEEDRDLEEEDEDIEEEDTVMGEDC